MAESRPSVSASPSELLREAARRLHGEPDPARAIDWVIDALGRVVRPTALGLCLFDDEGTPTWHEAELGTDRFASVGDPRASALLAPALDVPTGILFDDLPAIESNADDRRRLSNVVAAAHVLVVPVIGRTQLRGALLVGWDATSDPQARLRAKDTVGSLAPHLGIAIDNFADRARLALEEARGKEIVHRLQEAVRPQPPAVNDVDFGVHYEPADPSAPTGGDLYDWVLLPDGSLHITVVDVMGKGVQATKDAVMVTHALRLLAIDGCPLGDMVRRADELVTAQNPELVATLIVCRYRPDTGHLRLAGAGHPPALVIKDGEPGEVATPGIPIGWPGAGSHSVVETVLERDDTLVLYTDGLIEARKDIVVGLYELAEAARATASYPAKPMARVLIDRQLAGAVRRDDSVALVVRRLVPQDSTVPLGPLVHRFSPHTAAVQPARHLLADWLERVPVSSNDLDAILLAASELCANAVRHSSGKPGSVELRARVESGAIVLEVSDDGGTELPVSVEFGDVPDLDAERGRGLFLVRELMDYVDTAVVNGRTTVRVAKRGAVSVSRARHPAASSD